MRPPAGAEWIIILVIVLLLFGASRLPGLAQSVGRSMRIFRSEVKDGSKDAPTEVSSSPSAPSTTATPPTATPTTAPGTTASLTPGTPTPDDDGGRTHP